MTEEEKRKENEYLKQEAEKARREEWEKIKSLGPGARVRYFWDYYKFVLVIGFFVFMAVYIIANMIIGARTETVLYTCILNLDEYETGEAQLSEDFADSLGGLGRWQKVEFDTSMRLNPGSDGTSQLDVANTVKLTALLQAGTLDVFLAPADVTQFLQEQGSLLALDELEGSEWDTGSSADEYLYRASGTEDGAEHLYAVRIDQAGVLKQYGMHMDQEVWFSITANSDHTQSALKLYDFLMGQE